MFFVSMHCAGYEIYPIPQQIETKSAIVTVTPEVNLVIGEGVKEVSVTRIKEVLSQNGYAFTESAEPGDDRTNILVGENGSGDAADKFADDNTIGKSLFNAAENRFDAHIVAVIPAHANGDILLLGNGSGSEFYAMATLEQIFEQSGGNITELIINDYAYTQYRGIVEGFYGHPYSMETRMELMEFCKRYKLNTYVYGPKSDPYHLGSWRYDYPVTITESQRYMGKITQSDITAICEKAAACNVNFVWSIHPGMSSGINFGSTSSMDTGISEIMNKFAHMYSLGVRAFGVFIDDMSYTPPGNMQAYLADQTQQQLRSTYGDEVAPLFFVPTAYALNYGMSSTLYNLADVDEEVEIAFTGYDCFSNIRGSACTDMASRVGRNAIMWWNNPVNDDHDDRIYMRKLTTHWTIEDTYPIPSLGGLLLNPMNQGNASKVALFGGADYSWNPSAFDADLNWEAFFNSAFDNEEFAAALKTFASNSDALVEDEDLLELYTQFKQNQVPGGEMPACTAELIERMKTLYDACVYLQAQADNPEPKYSLMYEDIKCWVAKLKTMSEIIYKSLELMQKNEESMWLYYSDIKRLYTSLHTDSAYMVSALEDAGNNTYEVFYEVHPSQTSMEPFIEYLMPLLGEEYAVTLPERAGQAEIITNKASLPDGINITDTGVSISLDGTASLELKEGEYAGLYFDAIKEASLSAPVESLPDGLEIQYSVNGKEWTAYTLPDDIDVKKEIAYIRVKNISSTAVQIPFASLSVTVPATDKGNPVVSTNMAKYSSYNIENVLDGSMETYFWKNGGQKAGDYIMLDFSESLPRYGVTIGFTGSDRPSGKVAVEISEDGQHWTEKAEFTQADIDDEGIYTCNMNGTWGRYVRMYLKTVGEAYWLQVAEFSVDSKETIEQGNNENGKPVPCLSDRKLTTEYQASAAGFVTYKFIENITVETVSVYQTTDFTDNPSAPLVEAFADGEWVEVGRLSSTCSVFDLSGLDNLSEFRISWDDENIPALVEIYPQGEPYVEPAGGTPSAIEEYLSDSGMKVYRSSETLLVKSDKEIAEITVWNMAGELVTLQKTNDCEAYIPLPSYINTRYIISVKFADGEKRAFKL